MDKESKALLNEFFKGGIMEKLRDPDFQKKVMNHNEKGMDFMRSQKKDNKGNDENTRVVEIKVSFTSLIYYIAFIILMYFIWDLLKKEESFKESRWLNFEQYLVNLVAFRYASFMCLSMH